MTPLPWPARPDADHRSGRGALIARLFVLTRDLMPAMAAEHRWPIRLDHCFMRVCLDAAVGAPWSDRVKRPAVRHLSDDQIAAAVGIAEAIVGRPETLAALNERSLRDRRAARHLLPRPVQRSFASA